MNEELYKEITNVISKDLDCLTAYLVRLATDASVPVEAFQEELSLYLGGTSKRIRSALIFLFARMLYGGVDEKTHKLAAAVEILHNATLIHDDIIDSANTRRGKSTLHTKYDNRFAIIAGDFLLSKAISELTDLQSVKVIESFSKCLMALCCGEVEQYFAKNITPTINEYLEKSEAKTAALFVSALESLALINNDEKNISRIVTFARHFGRAFQLRDDLSNITNENSQKPLFADIENGIYTAAVIYAYGENKDLSGLQPSVIIETASKSEFLNKTQMLLYKELEFALNAVSSFSQNPLYEHIEALCNLLKK